MVGECVDPPWPFCTGTCMSDCIRDAFHLSDVCASCFGQSSACAMSNCKNACMGGEKSCIACAKKYCLEEGLTCTGLSREYLDQVIG